MARQKAQESATKISFNVPDEILERIDRLAEQAQIDRTRLIINILDETSKTLEFTGKVGLFQVSLLIRDMNDFIKETWAKSIKAKKIELR
ncbi:MAG: hypothetical protein ACOZBW_02370 [Thermodesulfobacteriota bacterium]